MKKKIRETAEEILQEYTPCYSEVDEDCLVNMLNRLASDVAREIFAEIERIRLKEIHKCETLYERENEVLQRKYWEGGYNSLRQLSYWISELKKKYESEDTE